MSAAMWRMTVAMNEQKTPTTMHMKIMKRDVFIEECWKRFDRDHPESSHQCGDCESLESIFRSGVRVAYESAYQEGYKDALDHEPEHDEAVRRLGRIEDAIAEFGDQPEICAGIIGEILDPPTAQGHSINADGSCNLGCG
jgi:hypothetical protein